MLPTSRAPRRGIHNSWLLCIVSVAVIGALVALLWGLGRRRPVGHGDDRELVVYCAAGMLKPMEQIEEAYHKEYGVRVAFRANGSKALLAELRKLPADADLFLAADEDTMEEARRDNVVTETMMVAVQRPVIAFRKDFSSDGIHSLSDLLRDDIHVALPNPETASIGSVVRKARPHEWAALEKQLSAGDVKISYAGTVTDVANLVKIGTVADAGIVWDTNARQSGLEFVQPDELKDIRDHVVMGLVQGCTRPNRALHFARYVTARDRGEKILADFHYEPVADAAPWNDGSR